MSIDDELANGASDRPERPRSESRVRRFVVGLCLVLAGGLLISAGQAATPWGYFGVALGLVTLLSGFGVMVSKERRLAGSASDDTGDHAAVVKELHRELTVGLWRYAACVVVFIVAGYLLQDPRYGVLIALGVWLLIWVGQFFFAMWSAWKNPGSTG